MRQTATLSTMTLCSANLPASADMLPTPVAATATNAANIVEETPYNRKKDGSLLRRLISGDPSPNGIGASLVSSTARFPDRAKLRAHTLDTQVNNPGIRMPLFGKHQVALENEISATGHYPITF